MQLPANSDQPQMSLVKRNAVLARHPRIVAMVWFASCGFLTGFFPGCLIPDRSHENTILLRMIITGIAGGITAALPGLAYGKELFDESKIKTNLDATGCGAKVVLASHLMLGLDGALFALIVNHCHFLEVLLVALMMIPILSLGSLLMGVITFPVGCAGAFILFRLRDWSVKPQGCAVHGYGMIEDEKPSGE